MHETAFGGRAPSWIKGGLIRRKGEKKKGTEEKP